MLEAILALGFLLAAVDVMMSVGVLAGCFVLACLIAVIVFVIASIVLSAPAVEDWWQKP